MGIFLPSKIILAADACANCVCATGAPQGALADQAACSALCVKNGTTFKSCATADATPAASGNIPEAKLCDCYCTSKDGAYVVPGGKIASAACTASCQKKGQRVAVCAFKLEQRPENTPFCFSDSLCKSQNGKLDAKQAQECIPGQKYCYPDPDKAAKATLNVAIGDYTASGDIGEYVNNLITWMMTAGLVIAIVLVMIGGLQYTLGAGSEGQIKAGKDRITHAVTGMILLLCSYVILNSVNPYLLRMSVPQYPMVKRVENIEGAACETLQDKYVLTDKDGKDISEADKKCGTMAQIKEQIGGGSVTGETTCQFTKCTEAGKKCYGVGDQAKCFACSEIIPGAAGAPVPSSAVCAALKRGDDVIEVAGQGKVVKQSNYCFFTHDPTVLLSTEEELKIAAATTAGTILTGGLGGAAVGGAVGAESVKKMLTGTCAELSIDCNAVRNDSDGCGEYDLVKAHSAAGDAGGAKMENFFLNSVWGDYNLKKLCESNPCNVKFRAEDGTVVDSIPQSNVCQLNVPKDYSLWDKMKNDCVQKGTMATAKTEWTKITPTGSCDPATCKKPYKCETDNKGKTACVACGDMKGLVATDGLCLDLDMGFSARCAYAKSDKTCRKVNCSNVKECKNYDEAVCERNICGLLGSGGNGCKISSVPFSHECVSK